MSCGLWGAFSLLKTPAAPLFNKGNAGPFPTASTGCMRSEGEATAHGAPPPTGGGTKVMAPTGSGRGWKTD